MIPAILIVATSVIVAYFVYRTLYINRLAAPACLVPKRAFLTANEKEFFNRLRYALPEFHVFPQVSMGALLDVGVPAAHPGYWPSRDLFSRKICDYVVCDKELRPVFVVELDDKTHDFKKDARRDDLVAHAGLRTVRFWSKSKPTREQIRSRVAEIFGPAVDFKA